MSRILNVIAAQNKKTPANLSKQTQWNVYILSQCWRQTISLDMFIQLTSIFVSKYTPDDKLVAFRFKIFFFVETWIDLLVHKILFCLLIPRPLKWLMCNGKQFEITFKVEYLRCFSLLLYATMRLDLNVLADSNCWRSFQSNEQSKSFKLTSTAKINGQ